MQFNLPWNIVIRNTQRRTFSIIISWVSLRSPLMYWKLSQFWILSQTLDRFHVTTHRLGTVNQVRRLFHKWSAKPNSTVTCMRPIIQPNIRWFRPGKTVWARSNIDSYYTWLVDSLLIALSNNSNLFMGVGKISENKPDTSEHQATYDA